MGSDFLFSFKSRIIPPAMLRVDGEAYQGQVGEMS